VLIGFLYGNGKLTDLKNDRTSDPQLYASYRESVELMDNAFSVDKGDSITTVEYGVSVVTPMYNEAGGAAILIKELHAVLKTIGDMPWEIIAVDDGSSDDTIGQLKATRNEGFSHRILVHSKNAGQSRAIRTGVLAAQYEIIVMIDGDGQNDPVDIPALLKAKQSGDKTITMVAGERQKRLDSGAKRFASRFANFIRQKLLNDGAADSGCGLKVFDRDAFLRLPYFDHLHRYLPFMMQREGLNVIYIPVGHRARAHGASKYTNFGRLIVAFRDLGGVMWLKARMRSPEKITEE